MAGYRRRVEGPRNGEPVNASVAGRAVQALNHNDAYLEELLRTLQRPGGVFRYAVAAASTTIVGQPVYWNADEAQYEPALLGLELDATTGGLRLSDSSQFAGIVVKKHAATIADVLLFGYGQFDDATSLDTSCGSSALGLYALSQGTAGRFAQAAQPGQPVVMHRLSATECVVFPTAKQFETSHSHAKFSLTCLPAGEHTPPTEGEAHVIDSPDDALPGWLPADHASFDGKAPTGAAFGYNLSADENLASWWPPAIVTSAVLVWNRGDGRTEGGEVVPANQAVVDANGIWWMYDCYDDVPWPTDYDSATDSDSESDDDPCPRNLEMSLELHLATLVADTDPSIVSSLRSTDDRIRVVCRGTDDDATVGALDIFLDALVTQEDESLDGSLVVKEVQDGDTAVRGRVIEGMRSTDARILVSGSHSKSISGNTYQQGLLTVSYADATTLELSAKVVQLSGSSAETSPVPYIGLPNGPEGTEVSWFIAQFEVPTILSGSFTFKYRARLIGKAAGTLPPLEVSYAIAPRPADGLDTPISAVGAYTTLDFETTATLSSTNQAVESTSEEISVSPGDIVLIKVLRDSGDGSDTYAAELGFMQQVGILESA